jgi:GNAT superfamily N-acetyltransferase
MHIDVTPFHPADDTAVARAWEIARAAWVHDVRDIPHPSYDTFAARLRHPRPGHDVEYALARVDGEPAGSLELWLPQRDNLHSADVELRVHPACRRRGAGRALHAHAVGRLRELGRETLRGETVRNRPDGDAFAGAMGAISVLDETRSRLDVTTLDQGRLDALVAEAWTHAAGYRFVKWDGVPPERFIDDTAYLDGRLNVDAPTGGLAIEAEKVDAQRIRDSEQRSLACGYGRYHGGVEHVASGRLVAWTTLAGPADLPGHLWQNITIVDPPHRGHRLGLIVKVENLRHALEHRPALAAVDTFNASSNAPMLAINVTLGFRPVDAWAHWQQTV